jgi:two-component system phosphate regulon response regulator OmpR
MDRLLQRELFSLIVLDFMLPVEDGLSICRRLRQSNIDTPIIMLTARGSDSDRIAGLEAGADDYLPKPFNPNELLARIRALYCVAKCVKFQVHQANKWKWSWSMVTRFINTYLNA